MCRGGGGPAGAAGFAGGADAADRVALAAGFAVASAEGGGGGGAVPTPNNAGEALGEDGSGSGAVAASIRAFFRSATRPAVMAFSCFMFGGFGVAGTLARLGKGALAPGGGGRCLAMAPPSRWCHQLTGLIDGPEEQPASSKAAAKGTAA